ncbi:MAG TPA: glycosyltransferase [Kiritimatiellia bacterium]|nr:glycosyltransferase [Kiritimatiellia bacterium]HPS07826.1 glycosyltransferase [Kiritimatiellia bacterium]
MNSEARAFPEPVPERRLRSRSRPNYSDRRASQRYLAKFPIRIFIGQGKEAKEYAATVHDISSGGLLIEAPEVPPEETRIHVKFRIPKGVMPEAFIQGVVSTDAEVRRHKEGDPLLGLAFEEDLGAHYERTAWSYLRWLAAAVLFVAASLILLIKYENLYNFWFDVPVFLYSLLVGGYLISRFFFASFYGDSKPLTELPTMSVIIPVRNEEANIARTLRQVMESDYPRDRLQVIAVNDCSTDRTLEVMKESQKIYPDLVVLGLEKQAGKRHALATGVGLATGQVITFIDSDSFIQPDALRHLVNRFSDPKVAAVTGHCDVENIWTNMLTRMQTVRYFIAFRVMKAAESVFDSVTCLSGPIAAYRREILQLVMPEWLNQMFMGRPATFGDDRSLTNSLLRRGYKVVYECKARVTTIVPEHQSEFLRQQLRWKRSWFREMLIASSFMWRREPLMVVSFYLGFILPLLGPAIVIRALIYVPLVQRTSPLMYIFGITLMSALMSSTYLLYKRSRIWFYGTVFCFYYMFVLVWQTPWAVLTCWRNEWITRS